MGTIENIKEKRGWDYKNFLTLAQKEELKYIIINIYPIIYKGWNGKIISGLIKVKYNVTYSLSAVYQLMKKLGITYKTTTKID
jgi:transposase